MTLRVERVLGLVTVQDLGRPGRMHEGLAAGGALVPGLLRQANRALGNVDGAPALEVCGRLELVAVTACTVAVPAVVVLAPDQRLVLDSEPRRVAYLALAGGVDAPLILGGRATQLSAGLGQPVRPGDRVTCSTEAARARPGLAGSAPALAPAPAPAPAPTDEAHVAIVPGPDLAAFADDAVARLCAASYRLGASSDRVGTRLDGPALPRRSGVADRPRPLVRGAIEVPGDGAPIVLGPEHPTTGGYPVLAVIRAADLDTFFAVRLGGRVRFTRAADGT